MNRNQRKFLSHQSPKTTEAGPSCTSSSLELPKVQGWVPRNGTASGLGHFQTPPAPQMGMAVPGRVRDVQEFPLEFHKSHGDSGPEHPCVKSVHLP